MKVLTRPDDTASENYVASVMEREWGCTVHRYGYLDAWDFIGVKGGKTAFIAELKTRNVESTTYQTVFLSAHKWFALSNAALGLGVPALFIVRFTDLIAYQRFDDIDASNNRIAGRRDRGERNDLELMIDVPISSMHVLEHAH